MKQYQVELTDEKARFYEDMSKILNCTVEEIIRRVLVKSAELMSMAFDWSE